MIDDFNWNKFHRNSAIMGVVTAGLGSLITSIKVSPEIGITLAGLLIFNAGTQLALLQEVKTQ